MKIDFVCTDPGVTLARQNGSAAHVRGIVHAFLELGHRVRPFLASTDGAEELGVPVVGFPGSRTIDAFSGRLGAHGRDRGRTSPDERSVLRALRHVVRNGPIESALLERWSRERPDLVYERYAPFSIGCGVSARALGIPHVLEVNAPLAWEGTVHRGQALPDAALLLERIAFANAGQIVAVSDALREHVVAEGANPASVIVVPNGVDPSAFRPDGRDHRGRLPPGVVVGFFGSLKPWHGLDALAAAFDAVADQVPELHLLVVGDGPGRVTIGRLAARRPGRVTRTGAVPASEIPAYLRATDIAVAPYPALERFYFSPVKLLEYMATGRAIVASRIGQIEHLVDHGSTGLLVPPGSIDDLALVLAQLARDAGLRERLGRAARREAVHAHSWTLRAAEILDGALAAATR